MTQIWSYLTPWGWSQGSNPKRDIKQKGWIWVIFGSYLAPGPGGSNMTQIGPILRETLNKWVVWASGPPPDLRGGPEANPKRDIKQRRPNMTSEGLVHSPCCTRPVQPWLQGVPALAAQACCTGGAQVVPCECAPGAPHACGTIRAEPAAHLLHSPCCTRPINP